MSQSANQLSTMNGMFKNTYADKLENLIPDSLVLQEIIKFQKKEKSPGNTFNQPLILGLEHG